VPIDNLGPQTQSSNQFGLNNQKYQASDNQMLNRKLAAKAKAMRDSV
jgi:hypothetical protein